MMKTRSGEKESVRAILRLSFTWLTRRSSSATRDGESSAHSAAACSFFLDAGIQLRQTCSPRSP